MSERVYSPIAKRMVPKADMVAVARYEASARAVIDSWLAHESDYWARVAEDAAGLG